ncbi:MAG: glycosyl transferase family 28 [Bacteroidota bacterium]|nr:glycosyl transferase family 28 [Bacteroidota bacterium]
MKKENNFNIHFSKLRVLISPLDWGLGHATRCIPIIKQLIILKCEVLVAADKQTFFLLKKEFPGITFLRLQGYNIRYSNKKRNFTVQILLQFPKLFFSIFNENRWLKRAVREYRIDAIISDNRFGMYSKSIPCVYITHQLFIKTGNTLSEKIAQKIHNYFIRKYTTCWVPDYRDNGLAGILSHPKKIAANVIYIGPLSRFEELKNEEIIYDLLISISGPEPQRTIFEKIILSQLNNFTGKVLLIRGLPGEKENLNVSNQSLKIVNHLAADEMNKAFEQSKLIISRSGYTTIMDIIKLQKTIILVPTPGQSEQEYLAKYLTEKKLFYSMEQENFSLNTALENVKQFNFSKRDYYCEGYKKVVSEFVESLSNY